MVSVGDKLPDAKFMVMSEKGPTPMSSSELFDGKKVILFALPGAFTPTCHANHMPGYVDNYETLKSKGVDEIAVVSVNDVWVMDAWGKALKATGKIHMLADGGADFTKAVGMEVDTGPAGMGLRSRRYSMLVEDGVVKTLNIEEKPGVAVNSGAATMLGQL